MKGRVQLAPRQLDLFRAPRTAEAPRANAPVAPPSLAPAPPAPPSLAPPPPATPTPELPTLELSKPPPSRLETMAQARLLAQRLADLVGPELKVLLSVHDNASTMMSFRRQPPLLKVRLHHMFLDAPERVVTAVVEYAARGRRHAGPVIDEFIASRQERIRDKAQRSIALSSRGRCFDLQGIFDALNEAHFQSGIRARIGWGRASARRRRRSIRLGVYDHKSREIRVHPALDKPDVPLFFVEFIVFHEMLHQLFPSERGSGRHVHHPRAFRDREKAFPRYQAAISWEKEHLQELLRR